MQVDFSKQELKAILRIIKPKIYNEWTMYSHNELEVLENIVKKIETIKED